MAKKSRGGTEPESTSPSVSPSKGIKLLKRQIQKGQELLENRPLSKNAYSGWENVTLNFLTRAFGSGSNDISSVMYATQAVQVYVAGASEEQLEHDRVQDLQSMIDALSSSVEILQTDVELNSPDMSEEKLPSRRLELSERTFDIAQVCLNGHCINESAIKYPEHNKNFCPACGATAITNCQYCDAEIQGHLIGEIPSMESIPPAFCQNCGEALPWTENKISAAKDLANELEGVDDVEKQLLIQSIDEIAIDSPRTTVAATRLKKILAKTGTVITGAFRDILVDIASETAKKILWPEK